VNLSNESTGRSRLIHPTVPSQRAPILVQLATAATVRSQSPTPTCCSVAFRLTLVFFFFFFFLSDFLSIYMVRGGCVTIVWYCDKQRRRNIFLIVLAPTASNRCRSNVCIFVDDFRDDSIHFFRSFRFVLFCFSTIKVARRKFETELLAAINSTTSSLDIDDASSSSTSTTTTKMTLEQAALGFVRVANEAMCRPIRALMQVRSTEVGSALLFKDI
jgi:hypothetical protein